MSLRGLLRSRPAPARRSCRLDNNRPAVEFDLLPAVPRFGLRERIEGLRLSMRLYNAVGTTSIYEGHGVAAETIAATALRLFTVEGAGLTFDEGWKGPLRPGFAADLAVLSDDPTQVPTEAIKDLRCTLTVVDGRIVHERGPQAGPALGGAAGWGACACPC